MRLVTDGHNAGVGLGDATSVVLVLGDTVDNVLLCAVRTRRTNQVDLIHIFIIVTSQYCERKKMVPS